ncbi:hypothetical protein LF65_01965 [Clostridium beijerinckii]|uniref:Uncharacterized protein n=1 Tax=Clostridium beijerinckii TaxID=1520 RepID=A0A0B5QNY5_CLOBE|nr:hypothetical protein [Clostridium beijerinckii]AJG98563.1 hypothetical protein LF65_01965 [Clostridium beijerinckii]
MADNNELFNLICKMCSNMQEGFSKVYERMAKLEKQITKNIELIENIDEKVRLLVDGQVIFKEKELYCNNEGDRTVYNNLDFIMDSLKRTSMKVSNLAEIVEVIKGYTGKNRLDIKIIKKRYFKTD